MKNILTLILVAYCSGTLWSQFSVGSGGMTIKSGTVFSSQGLVITPSSDLTISNNAQSLSATAVTLDSDDGILRRYDFTSPVSFSGTLGIKYSSGELNGNSESTLDLIYKPLTTGNDWLFRVGSSRGSAGSYYVTNTFSGTNIASLSAIDLVAVNAPSASGQNFCGSATVADLVATGDNLKWYDQSSGGSLLNPTDALSTGTYYVSQTKFGIESSRTSVSVTVTPLPTISSVTSASRCGTGAITLEATPSAGTIDWFMAATGGTSGYTGSTINLSLSGTKTYYVEASDNGCVSAARTAVTATIDFCSQIQASQCGVTVAASNTPIIADAAVGATHYRFEITNGSGGVQTITKTTRTLYLANFTYYYDSTYAIRVAVSNDGTSFSAYGSSCNITAPAIPASQVQASQCNTTLATPTTAIIADAVTGATHYRFEIDGGAQYVTKTTRTLYQANFTFAYNTTYAIRVAASTDGTNFGVYGASCNITTSAAPTTKVQASQCGTTLATVSTAIIADAVTGATHYRFEIDGGAQYVTKTTRTLYLANFTYALATTYAIRVSYSLDGTNFQAYGSSCNITSPASAIKLDGSIDEMTQDLMTDMSIEAYPNPNSGDFTISSTHEGTLSIINEVGQLIQMVSITKDNNLEARIEGLQQGVYFITGTINNEVVAKKVLVLR